MSEFFQNYVRDPRSQNPCFQELCLTKDNMKRKIHAGGIKTFKQLNEEYMSSTMPDQIMFPDLINIHTITVLVDFLSLGDQTIE